MAARAAARLAVARLAAAQACLLAGLAYPSALELESQSGLEVADVSPYRVAGEMSV